MFEHALVISLRSNVLRVEEYFAEKRNCAAPQESKIQIRCWKNS